MQQGESLHIIRAAEILGDDFDFQKKSKTMQDQNPRQGQFSQIRGTKKIPDILSARLCKSDTFSDTPPPLCELVGWWDFRFPVFFGVLLFLPELVNHLG